MAIHRDRVIAAAVILSGLCIGKGPADGRVAEYQEEGVPEGHQVPGAIVFAIMAVGGIPTQGQVQIHIIQTHRAGDSHLVIACSGIGVAEFHCQMSGARRAEVAEGQCPVHR